MNSPYKGKFKVSQIYKGSTHKGLDLVGIEDKNIYSTIDGIVEVAWLDSHPTGGMGLYIRIKSTDDFRCYYFAHLSKVFVKTGQKVNKGDLIGVEGNTGHSTGSHLHYEIREEPDNTTFLNVAEISGIPNELGVYGGDDMTFSEALEVLIKNKIIMSPEYWKQCASTTFYIKGLIINMAEFINKQGG